MTRYTLFLVQRLDEAMDRDLQWHVHQQLEAAISTPPEQTEICVVLQSLGGDAHATYKMFLDLRSRCMVLEAIIPDYAKSAATLLVLGMDKIWMGPCAELGPLDVQIPHPDRDGETISGLDARYCLEYLADTCVRLVLRGANAFVNDTAISRQLGLRESSRFIDAFMQPIVAKLDPHLMHRAAQQLRVAGDYAVRMMHARNEDVCSATSEEDIQRICKLLIEMYSTHEFVISRNEAHDLGLPIRAAEEHPYWHLVNMACSDALENDDNLVRVMADAEMVETPEQAGAKAEAEAEADSN
ncbi:MAG: hypothetical protein KGJ62_11720 [Armatimonadetes bacterium]|nr:hypothetical protein [Armatimonadota bacterium]MDE2206792.1 hypothetical protein [Armatimonadota bacterium]